MNQLSSFIFHILSYSLLAKIENISQRNLTMNGNFLNTDDTIYNTLLKNNIPSTDYLVRILWKFSSPILLKRGEIRPNKLFRKKTPLIES